MPLMETWSMAIYGVPLYDTYSGVQTFAPHPRTPLCLMILIKKEDE